MSRIQQELLEAVADYLNAEGIDNGPTEVPADRKEKKWETAIEFAHQPVESMWVENMSHDPNQQLAACRFRVIVDRPLTKASKQDLDASAFVIRERKILRTLLTLGIKKGKAFEVEWRGGRIAEVLNGDADLSRMLVEYADAYRWWGGFDITVWPEAEPGSWVDIRGPTFSLYVPDAHELPSAVPFELYARIARHIRDLAII